MKELKSYYLILLFLFSPLSLAQPWNHRPLCRPICTQGVYYVYCWPPCRYDYYQYERQVDEACVSICIDKEHSLPYCNKVCSY